MREQRDELQDSFDNKCNGIDKCRYCEVSLHLTARVKGGGRTSGYHFKETYDPGKKGEISRL